MKGLGKSFAVAMLIIGTVIGAGFASGRELVSFFGSRADPWTAVFCALLIFIVSVVFLWIGSRLNAKNVSEVNIKLAGRFHFVTDAFLLVNNLIVLSGMLAGMDSLGSIFLKIKPVYSIVSGLLCAFVVTKGIKGLLDCNKVVVPVMVAALVAVAVASSVLSGGGEKSAGIANFGVVIVYVAMNMMLASTVLTTVGKMDKKTIFISSGVAAALMGILIFMLMLALNRSPVSGAEMPVLEMAKALHPFVYYLMAIVIAISIFTTMLTAMSGLVSWFSTFLGNKPFCAIIVLALGFALSNLGFSNVVKLLYPVIGALGVIYTALGVIFAVRSLPLKTVFRRMKVKSKR